jgi:hypothetical protein
MCKSIFNWLVVRCRGRRVPQVIVRTSDVYLAALLTAKRCPIIAIEREPKQLPTMVIRVQPECRPVISAFTAGREVSVNVRLYARALARLTARVRRTART